MTRLLGCVTTAKKKFLFNFTIYEVHCQRNIGVCPICKELFTKSDVETHMAAEHHQVTCKCNKESEKRLFKKDEETECPLWLAVCQHCDLELSILKLKEHEDYCGAQTELCVNCGCDILVKDLKTHPEVGGREGEEKRNEVAIPPNAYDESWGQDGIWIISQLLRQIEVLDPPTRLLGRPLKPLNQMFSTIELPTKATLQPSANLDFMLALSLQNEGQASSVAEQDFWRAVCEADQSHGGPGSLSDVKSAANETMLPCEYSEELYPEELLIDHQTSCNPSRALPSFTTGSSSPRGVEEPDVIFQNFLQEAASNQLDSSMGLSNSRPVEESIIIPHEFCGVQLEEEVLFHHQDQCDQCPTTATNHMTEGIPRLDSQPQEISPELPRRCVRHQGDLSSGYLDDTK
ncbi:TRAF-type zinc finger domain-containing protein 1 [Plecturocebus cupreus]